MNKWLKFGLYALITVVVIISLLPVAAAATRVYNTTNPYAPEVSVDCVGNKPVLSVNTTDAPVNSWVEVSNRRAGDSLKFTQKMGEDFGYSLNAEPGGYVITVRRTINPLQDPMPVEGQVLSVQYKTVEVCGE